MCATHHHFACYVVEVTRIYSNDRQGLEEKWIDDPRIVDKFKSYLRYYSLLETLQAWKHRPENASINAVPSIPPLDTSSIRTSSALR